MLRVFFIIFLIGITLICKAQNSNHSFLKPEKIGVLFNKTNEKNFWFDDTDYFYESTIVKSQFFYPLFDLGKTNFDLMVQPQYHFIKHQLLNPQYITPEVPNYLAIRDQFTALKNIHLYALEFGFSVSRALFKGTRIEITAGLGFAYIDTETERLA